MSNPTDLPDRIGRYVRGELSDKEAEEFEELYFQDEQLARLVEAEQILQQAPDLIGTKHALDESSSFRRRLSVFGERRYAYAASIAVLSIATALAWLAGDNRALRHENAQLQAVTAKPSISDGMIRLSAMRGARDEEPAFTIALPAAADRFVTLQLSIPEKNIESGPATIQLARLDGGEPVWEKDVDARALASQIVLVNLPGGSVEPGDYVIALRRHGGAAEAITIAEYAFRVVHQ